MKTRSTLMLQRLFTAVLVLAFMFTNFRPISVVRADDVVGTDSGEVLTGGVGDAVSWNGTKLPEVTDDDDGLFSVDISGEVGVDCV